MNGSSEADAASASDFPNTPQLEDSLALVDRARLGNAGALNDLFGRYYERVYRVVRIRLGAKLRRVLEECDLVQETFMVAERKIKTFEPRDHAAIIQWLARIAENQIHAAHDRARAQKRDIDRMRSFDAPSPEAKDSAPSWGLRTGGPSPSSIVANRELKEIYDACVEQLAEQHREIILWREYSDAPWERICTELGKPTAKAAQEAYRRAQIELAKVLRRRLRD
jgi:RNA polymerase sigma-70 factor (ECF subfamily)